MRSRRLMWLVALTLLTLITAPPIADAQKRGGTLRVSYGNEIANLDFHTAPGYEMMWVAMNVGLRAGEHHARRQVRRRRRRVVDRLRPTTCCGRSSSGRTSSSTTARRSTRRPSSSASTGSWTRPPSPACAPSTSPCTRVEVARSADRAAPHEAAVRVPPAHAGGVPHGPDPLLAGGDAEVHASRTASRASPARSSAAGRSSSWSGSRAATSPWSASTSTSCPACPTSTASMIRVIKDPVTEMAAFKNGEVDFIASFSPEHVDTLKAQNPEGRDHDGQGNDARCWRR